MTGARFRNAVALIDLECGHIDEARQYFRAVVADWGAPDMFWRAGGIVFAELASALDERDYIPTLYEKILPYADRIVTIAPGTACVGSVSFPLGLLAAAMERWDAAERHYQAAIATNNRFNFRPWVAWSRLHYAKMLIARDAPADRERALELLGQALDAAQDMGMKKLLNQGLELKLRTQGIISTDVRTSIEVVAAAVQTEQPEISVHAAPDGTVTIMFSDIEDSTALTERLGDQAWQELLRKHNAIVRECIAAHGGFEVKTMGDGFMVAFQSAKKGLDCAIAIQRAFDLHNAADGEHVKVRIGLHAGEAIKDGDDFYGKNVILASRVAGKAVGGEILVSSLLRQLVESSTDAAIFGEPREVELKGLSGAHVVFAVAST